MRTSPRADGFTLIELMIVVAILGVLASIAIPAFLGYRLSARSAEAPVNLRAISILEESFLVGNEAYASAAANPTGTPGKLPQSWGTGGAFRALGWRPEGDVYFQYQVATDSTNLSYVAAARADLDGDSAFQVWAIRATQPSAGSLAECPFGGTIATESTVQPLFRGRY